MDKATAAVRMPHKEEFEMFIASFQRPTSSYPAAATQHMAAAARIPKPTLTMQAFSEENVVLFSVNNLRDLMRM
ncbi:MAG: hypothetical protein NTV94_01935 [Planctomycetota bacterium]|nr:hypothetical protein [Planctomycetota bacterium]